jgi:hypothetical protein
VNFIIDFLEGTAYISLCIHIPMASSDGHALDSKLIREQLNNDSDSFSEFSQDSDIDVFDCIDSDAEISGPGLSCNNSDGQVSANVGGGDIGYDDGGGCSSGYNDKDDDD